MAAKYKLSHPFKRLGGAAIALHLSVSCSLIVLPSASIAQQKPTRAATKLELQQVEERRQEALARQERLRKEIDALNRDRGAINRALIKTATRAQALEAQVQEQEAVLAKLLTQRSTLQQSVTAKQALLSQLLATLQRMGRQPPPALLITPDDALTSVRAAIVMGTVIPDIRRQTDTLAAELAVLQTTTRKIEDQKKLLTTSLNTLAEDESLLSLLINEKNALARRSDEELEAERKRAAELARKSRSLTELVKRLEQEVASSAAAAKAAKEADKQRRAQEQERLAAARKALEKGQAAAVSNAQTPQNESKSVQNPARIAPAVAFSKALGSLPLPVQGVTVHTFGSSRTDGSKAPNMAVATRKNARVRAPSDAWVVYAGPFRSYGQLLILNAGENYRIILAGLSEVNVEPGRFVLAGEPVGRMGVTPIAASSSQKLGSTKPVLYVEFKKDGRSIDPTPWWKPKDIKGLKDDS